MSTAHQGCGSGWTPEAKGGLEEGRPARGDKGRVWIGGWAEDRLRGRAGNSYSLWRVVSPLMEGQFDANSLSFLSASETHGAK